MAYSGTVTKVACKTYTVITKSSKALPNSEIVKLSKMSDGFKGTKEVKKYVGKLNLPQDIKEDLYLRIAIHQKKIPQDEAKSMFANLKGKDGFSSTLSKVIGNNIQGTKGHLNELRIANSASKSGFKVVSIGKKFDDYSTPNSQDNKTEILIPPLTCYVKPQLSNGLHTLHH
jgi:hypothetical protein